MTNLELEARLTAAAEALPEPKTGFAQLKAMAERTAPRRRSPVKRLAIACAIIAALTITAAAGFTSYQLINHGAYVWPATTADIGARYGVAIPSQLGGYPLHNADYLLLAPDGISHEASLWKQVYRYAVLYYQTEDIIGPSVALGSTTNPYWAACFSYDPDTLEWFGNSRYTHLNQTTAEYGGQTLYLYDTSHIDLGDNRTFVTHSVTWVDTEQCVCWEVSGGSTAEALSAAKELIDANR